MNISEIIRALPRFMRRHKLIQAMLRVCPSSRIQEIRFNGSASLYADLRDPFARSYLIAEGFDPEFFAIAAPFLSNGGVFFDVGANFGFCTFGLIDLLGGGAGVNYHLFEANGDICSLLARSAALHAMGDIWINRCCVTDVAGVSRFQLVADNFGASHILSDGGGEEVENLILDEYVARHSIRRINLLKIDIEGWEARAFRGGINTLASGAVDAVYFEASSENLGRAGFSLSDCFSILEDAGFCLYYVRSADFHSGVADERKSLTLGVNGHRLTVARVGAIPTRLHTDILAVHKSCAYIGL
ncbi:MAG: FkbM family methyltransferase [Deltaproteobacteria bacterium]